MPQIKFTDRKIANLPKPTKGQVDYFDQGERGFGIRASVGGTKTWFVKYVYHGRQRRMTLAQYPAVRLAQARKTALNVKNDVAKGIDPATKKQADRAAPTLKELADEYLERHAKKRKRSWREDERIINTYLKEWHDRKAGDISRREVISLLDDIADRAPVQANRVLSLLRKLYNFGLIRERVEANPAHKVPAPGTEVERDRIYEADEMRKLWETFQGATGDIYKLILITGQRQSEVAGMRWDELDFDDASWTVPGERMKSKRVHLVPLSSIALEVLRNVPRVSDKHVFPSPTRPDQSIANLGKAAKRIKQQSGIADFRSHDLRRTCGSNITKRGFSRFIMDRVLGHLEPGVGARYDRHDYLKEKRAALRSWGRRLQEIISGEPASAKVVELRGRAE